MYGPYRLWQTAYSYLLLAMVRAENNSHWIERILNETTRQYDNKIIPLQSGKPLKLELRLFLMSLADLQSVDSHFSTELLLHSSWVDHRLAFNEKHGNSCRITGDGIKLLWTPDIIFASEKSGRQSTVTKRNMFGKISSSGRVVTSERYLIEHYCSMDFFFYPFDEQVCEIQLMSFAYSRDWLNVSWLVENPVFLSKYAEISGKFLLMEFETKKIVDYFQWFGHYDILALRVKLRRRDTALVLRIYVPLTVMVIMSWFCFFIDYQSVPARTSMSAALVLTIITFIASIRQELPRAPSGRILDIHMLVCFLYIFAGLVEYSLLRSSVIKSRRSREILRKKDAKETQLQNSAGQLMPITVNSNSNSNSSGNWRRTTQRLKEMSQNAVPAEDEKRQNHALDDLLRNPNIQREDGYHFFDRISMVCFPVSFILYCCCYFFYVRYGQ